MKYSGIDLHSNNSVVTVTDEEDRVMAEKRLPPRTWRRFSNCLNPGEKRSLG